MRTLVRILFLLVCSSLTYMANAQAPIKIWDDTEVKAKSVTILPFIPDSMPKAAVIVCPGGSYCWLDYENEGTMVAEWLKENGIAAFVLKYRTAGWFAYAFHYRVLFRGNQHPDMICDVQRAIQYVREEVFPYGTLPVGVMGFSAGGHLAMSSACYYQTNFLSADGVEVRCSLRPDFVAPIYPVVTFTESCMHERSCRGLLGDVKKKQVRDSLSLERHIPENCPPVFLVNCKDDPIVDYHNSMLLDSALTANNVTHKYIMYQTGGHGFGANPEKGTAECRTWRSYFLEWISQILK